MHTRIYRIRTIAGLAPAVIPYLHEAKRADGEQLPDGTFREVALVIPEDE